MVNSIVASGEHVELLKELLSNGTPSHATYNSCDGYVKYSIGYQHNNNHVTITYASNRNVVAVIDSDGFPSIKLNFDNMANVVLHNKIVKAYNKSLTPDKIATKVLRMLVD